MKTDLIKMDTVEEYNKLFGLETLHPLVNVIDLSEATRFPTRFTINYGIYALFLKETKCGDIRYGRQVYDYREGTITSFAPGQVSENYQFCTGAGVGNGNAGRHEAHGTRHCVSSRSD